MISTSLPMWVRRVARRTTRPVRWRWSRAAAYHMFLHEFHTFRRLAASSPRQLDVRWKDRYPCLDDRTPSTGFDRVYLLHLSWAARILAQTRPEQHVDVSSYVYFAALVSAFVPIKFLEYRPVELPLSGLTTGQCDLLSLPFDDGSVNSLSCMHVLEHVGLGRYGDPLDADSDLAACAELRRVLAPGGTLLIVVPVGQPRVMFNAHRIYSFQHVVEMFPDLELLERTLIPDDASGLIEDCEPSEFDRQRYGCGCFRFRRPL